MENKGYLTRAIPILMLLLSLAVAGGIVSCGHKDHNHGKEESHEGHDHGTEDAEKTDHREADPHNHESDHTEEKDGHDDKEDDHGHHGHGHDDHDEEGAITAKDEKLGIQLLPEAVETIGLKTRSLRKFRRAPGTYVIPPQSLISYEYEEGIYIKRGPWYNLIPVKKLTRGRGGITIRSPHLRASDHLIIEGAALLRLAHLEAFGASGDGHGH